MRVRQNQGSSGFSLVELMITIAIVGVLASIGTSSFQAYTKRVYESEANSTLGMLYRGANSYWNQPLVSQGLGASGAGQCLVWEPLPPGTPPTGQGSAFPSLPPLPRKQTFDYTTIAAFSALGFSKSDPSYFSIGWDARITETGWCGDHGDGELLYAFMVISDIDGDGLVGGSAMLVYQQNGGLSRSHGYYDWRAAMEGMGIPCPACSYGID